VGKTRLALQAAADTLDFFADGVFLVQLASIADPDLVVPTIAQVLAVREAPGLSGEDRVAEFLRDRHMLLILDNFEQVVEAAPRVAHLLATCPRLKTLVTSRAVLRLSGEHDFPVAALALPRETGVEPAEQLAQYAAVRLFVERARATRPDFNINPQNASVIASICSRVDGLPLAIELAAARVRHVPVDLLHARLQRSLDLLVGGNRDLPARQRALRDTTAWSYDLLTADEKRFFRQFGIFVGGATVEAAEAVCDLKGCSALDLLGQLIDNSLVLAEDHAIGDGVVLVRYRSLETLREFALDRLATEGELAALQRRHVDFYVSWAEQAAVQLRGSSEAEWLRRLELEQGNFRAALAWAASTPDEAVGLRMVAAIWPVWSVRGQLTEGRAQLQGFLDSGGEAEPLVRARALEGAGVLARTQDDYAQAAIYHEESLALRTAVADHSGAAASRYHLGSLGLDSGDYAAAEANFEASLTLHRALGDTRGIAACLSSLGVVAWFNGDHPRATTLFKESLGLRRDIGDRYGMAMSLRLLAEVTSADGAFEPAAAYVEECLRLRRQLGDKNGLGHALLTAGDLARRRGNSSEALAHYRECLVVDGELGNRAGIARCLDRLAGILAPGGQPHAAARLFGSAAAVRRSIGSALHPEEQAALEKDLAVTRGLLSPEDFEVAWAAGELTPPFKAIEGVVEVLS